MARRDRALHGVASSPGVHFADTGDFSYATSFPQPILMGAAFDDELIEAVATVVSTEARAFNNFNRSGLDYWVCVYYNSLIFSRSWRYHYRRIGRPSWRVRMART